MKMELMLGGSSPRLLERWRISGFRIVSQLVLSRGYFTILPNQQWESKKAVLFADIAGGADKSLFSPAHKGGLFGGGLGRCLHG
jgi:hypothetical protein